MLTSRARFIYVFTDDRHARVFDRDKGACGFFEAPEPGGYAPAPNGPLIDNTL